MIVVCKTSPIIALACVGRLDLLRAVHGEILVPDAVFDEITVAGAGEPGASEVAQAAWIKRRPVLDALRANAGFWIDDNLYNAALAAANE